MFRVSRGTSQSQKVYIMKNTLILCFIVGIGTTVAMWTIAIITALLMGYFN